MSRELTFTKCVIRLQETLATTNTDNEISIKICPIKINIAFNDSFHQQAAMRELMNNLANDCC